MKLRLHGDTVRLRLSRSEVECLARGEVVEACTRFSPEQRLSWRVALTDAARITATFTGAVLAVGMPAERGRAWALGDAEGLYEQAPESEGGTREGLSIAIEKDFSCLHSGDSAENRDTFPNPRAAG